MHVLFQGAVLLLFKVDGRYILHVGDFRYHPNMQSYDELRRNEIHSTPPTHACLAIT
jgi:mRNA degradation ribonuclease J1/J2